MGYYRMKRFKLVKEIGEKLKPTKQPIEVLEQLAKMEDPVCSRELRFVHGKIIRKVTGKMFDHQEAYMMLRRWFSEKGINWDRVPGELQSYSVLWGAFRVIINYGGIPRAGEIEDAVKKHFKGTDKLKKKVVELLRCFYVH